MKLSQLIPAALDRKSVIGSRALGCGHRPTPAAWIIGMQFKFVSDHVHELKIYRPKPKQKTKVKL
jgi:hypothetical protein